MSADFKDRTSAELTQRYFMAALTVIREQLAIHVRGPDSGEPDGDRPGVLVAQREVERYRRALTHPAPIDMLCAVFGLGAFERDIILLCAGAELDRDIADACDAIHGTATPTLGLALTVLPGAVWGPLAPGAPLRQWRIIEVSPGARLLDRTLHLDESILHFLLGLRAMDQRLLGLFAPVRVTPSLVTSQIVVAENVAQLWSSKNSSLPIVALCGAMPLTLRAVAQLACEYGRLDLYSISAADLPDTAAEQIIAASLWERHAALTVSALLIELVGDNDSARSKAMAFVRRIQGPLLLSTAEPLPIYDRTVVRIDVPRPQQSEQRALWLKHLGEQAAEFTDVLDAVTAQFCLDGSAVAAVAAGLRARPSSAEDGDPSNGTPRTRLWRACRAQTRPRMDELAQHIEPRATFDDLIVGERQESLLREIAVHVRQRVCVYRDWGFARSSARGLGVSALFAGPSGTGKTTAAEVLAGELDLDLYRIDLSAMVSKYIGETEKNLRRVFDAAEGGGAILLFDEADALFGKRSEVKDSHDRYANMEVSYLLQRIEAYSGLAILTSNLRDSIDSAFLRRIRFVIEFPFPSRDQRVEIWRRVIPADAPTSGIDFAKLARLNLAGGTIRNVAMAGAFLAAEEQTAIEMRHFEVAVRTELAKLERPVSERDLKDWT